MSGEPSLSGMLDLAWSRLEAGVRDASAPARTPALATLGPEGPEIRTLVLRAADRGAGTLDLHADAASAKVAQLRADPRAALHLWDAGVSLQVRVRGRVSVLTGAEADEAWAAVPEAARSSYGGEPAPGRPLTSPEAREAGAERGRFAVLRLRAGALEGAAAGGPPPPVSPPPRGRVRRAVDRAVTARSRPSLAGSAVSCRWAGPGGCRLGVP